MRIRFVLTLILASSFNGIGQIGSEGCKKIRIAAPDTVSFGRAIKVSASYAGEEQPSVSKFDWFVVKETESTKTREVTFLGERRIVELYSWAENEGGSITLIAKSRIATCDQIAISKIYVSPTVGTPLILDEYAKLNWNDERGRLDAVIAEMKNRPKHELLVYMYFHKGDAGTMRRQRISRILGHLTQFRKFDPKRITLLISTEESTKLIFQSVPVDMLDIYGDESFLRIPAEKFGQYQQLFR